MKEKKSSKPKPRFSRAVLPPEKFHTTKKGERGYERKAEKEVVRQVREEDAS
jgi:hypothetical protein